MQKPKQLRRNNEGISGGGGGPPVNLRGSKILSCTKTMNLVLSMKTHE